MVRWEENVARMDKLRQGEFCRKPEGKRPLRRVRAYMEG
jgi:hypothetical protein